MLDKPTSRHRENGVLFGNRFGSGNTNGSTLFTNVEAKMRL